MKSLSIILLSFALLPLVSCQMLPDLPVDPVFLAEETFGFGGAIPNDPDPPENVSMEMNQALANRWPREVTAADKSIYESYSAAGPSKQASNWLASFDFSGVAFDNVRTCTLIGPRHVIMAKHYQRPLDSDVVFHDREGQRVACKLIAKQSIDFTDVTVGLLDREPPNCAVYPVLPAWGDGTRRNWELALFACWAMVTDQERKALLYGISGINGSSCVIRRTTTPAVLRENTISGDSGNPSFLPYGRNQLVLLTTSWYGGSGISGPDLSSERLQDAIRAAIIQLNTTNK